MLVNVLDTFAKFKNINRFINGQLKDFLHMHGLGRHTREEQQEIGLHCLGAVSKVLGNNKFLFGDNPCDEDCCIFGFTTFILYNIPMNFYHGAMKEKFPNLVNFLISQDIVSISFPEIPFPRSSTIGG